MIWKIEKYDIIFWSIRQYVSLFLEHQIDADLRN